MSTSKVSFRNKSFEANDLALEVVLKLMVREADDTTTPSAWLRKTRDDWDVLATQEFGFGCAPDFDSEIQNDVQASHVRGIIERVVERVQSMADPIPADVLNALNTGQRGHTQNPKIRVSA